MNRHADKTRADKTRCVPVFSVQTRCVPVFSVSLKRRRPYGEDGWTARMIERMGLAHTARPEGRPKCIEGA